MILKNKNGVAFFQFPNLAQFDNICHGVFTRNGGYSGFPYQSLNISLNVGDAKNDVVRNRRIIEKCFDKKLVFVDQNHGTNVLSLDKNHAQNIAEFSKYDAMITNMPKKMLAIQTADCQAVLMYDPIKNVVANVHSGWRGSVKNIIQTTIKAMENNFDCKAENIFAGISPSLGPCCAQFRNYKEEFPETLLKYKVGIDRFDFWKLSGDQLCETGMPPDNIHSSKICTKCNDLFFSFRREAVTGRFACVIGLQ